MSDLTPSSGRRMTRSQREGRAFRLVVTAGVSGTVAVVGFVLAAIGVIDWFIPFVALVVAVVAGFLFRRSVS